MAFHYFTKLFPLCLPPKEFKKKKFLKAFSMITQCAVHFEMNYVPKYVYCVQTVMQVYHAW